MTERDLYGFFESELLGALSERGRADSLRRFHRAMKAKAELVGRELVTNDTARLQAQSGAIRILYELADWAASALEASASEAKDADAEGIPRALT